MRVEIDLCVGENRRELLDTVGGATLSEFMCEMAGVMVCEGGHGASSSC